MSTAVTSPSPLSSAKCSRRGRPGREVLRGLGDPSRLRILELRWCGFIEARREGRAVYNWIADERVEAMLDLADSCSGR